MNNLENDYTNSQKLWDKIRKLKSYNTTRNDNLIVNNWELIQEADKEKEHRKIWQNIFKKSDEENQQYDPGNERLVRQCINNNSDQITPYQTSEIDRFHNQEIDQLITLDEIKNNDQIYKNKKAIKLY